MRYDSYSLWFLPNRVKATTLQSNKSFKGWNSAVMLWIFAALRR